MIIDNVLCFISLIAFIYCANLGVNATFLLVYLYIIVYFSTKM